MKIWLNVTLLVVIFGYTQGATKILQEVNILSDNANRHETFSLKNENPDTEELVIEGNHLQHIFPMDNTDFLYRVETIYLADKDGYRVKYKLIRIPKPSFATYNVQLNASTLKSLAG